RWPYQPPVPDDESRGRIEQLLFEMDQNGVDQAVLICANIDRNPDNNDYVAQEAREHASRIHQFPDVDCFWSSTYHTPGAPGRLRHIAERWPIKGFTHYLSEKDDGAWLYSSEGLEFFRIAEEKKLIASIACHPHQQPAIRKVAERYPSLPILCHHLSHVQPHEDPPHKGLKEVLASARLPNIFLKVSGFYYGAQIQWDYPYSGTLWVVRTLYEHFGPYRMCWGSDYPVVRSFMTYRQALEVVRSHCSFIAQADMPWVLGDSLYGLLTSRQVG
ncbi:MAG: amidohydrolase family protein, partial [Chloroflexota bacterium]|nr:amidohydrolase family protein [Chloroflexota bacterium]